MSCLVCKQRTGKRANTSDTPLQLMWWRQRLWCVSYAKESPWKNLKCSPGEYATTTTSSPLQIECSLLPRRIILLVVQSKVWTPLGNSLSFRLHALSLGVANEDITASRDPSHIGRGSRSPGLVQHIISRGVSVFQQTLFLPRGVTAPYFGYFSVDAPLFCVPADVTAPDADGLHPAQVACPWDIVEF